MTTHPGTEALTLPGLEKLARASWDCLDFIQPDQLSLLSQAYRYADPFPHVVIDGLFDSDFLHEIQDEFDSVPAEQWRRSRHRLQDKQGTQPGYGLPDATRRYFDGLHGAPMTRFLSAITGVDALVGDPTLENAGMHQIPQGGRFELHVDFARHPKQQLKTRLVLITYLNEGWLAGFGGTLDLWRWKPREHRSSIVPLFGRTAIMEVGPRNVHGHPTPVCSPGGAPRRSVAAYYYTALPAGDRAAKTQVTGYVDRPGASPGQRVARFLYTMLPKQAASAARGLFGKRIA